MDWLLLIPLDIKGARLRGRSKPTMNCRCSVFLVPSSDCTQGSVFVPVYASRFELPASISRSAQLHSKVGVYL